MSLASADLTWTPVRREVRLPSFRHWSDPYFVFLTNSLKTSIAFDWLPASTTVVRLLRRAHRVLWFYMNKSSFTQHSPNPPSVNARVFRERYHCLFGLSCEAGGSGGTKHPTTQGTGAIWQLSIHLNPGFGSQTTGLCAPCTQCVAQRAWKSSQPSSRLRPVCRASSPWRGQLCSDPDLSDKRYRPGSR